MTTLLPFRRRPRTSRWAPVHPGVTPTLDVTLTKAGRRRRYWIRPGRHAGQWYAQVFFDDAQHRGIIVDSLHETHRLYAEYGREIDEAVADGWVVSASRPN